MIWLSRLSWIDANTSLRPALRLGNGSYVWGLGHERNRFQVTDVPIRLQCGASDATSGLGSCKSNLRSTENQAFTVGVLGRNVALLALIEHTIEHNFPTEHAIFRLY
jgi:hypothetical protein